MDIALIGVAVILVIVIVILFASVKVAREYERGVIFRLGRLLPEPKGPGLFFLIPFVDRMVKVELRTVTLNVPPQEVITKVTAAASVSAPCEVTSASVTKRPSESSSISTPAAETGST